MISRREGLTQLCSEEILIKLREHGHCISDKADTGDIDQKNFSMGLFWRSYITGMWQVSERR